MQMKIRPMQDGKATNVTVFIEDQNAGKLRFNEGEYETFLLAIVGGAALLKESECNKVLEVVIDDRR